MSEEARFSAQELARRIASMAMSEAYYSFNNRGYFMRQTGGSVNLLNVIVNTSEISINNNAAPDFRALYTFICVFDTVTVDDHRRLSELQARTRELGVIADIVAVDAGLGIYENLAGGKMTDRNLENVIKKSFTIDAAVRTEPVRTAAPARSVNYRSSAMGVVYALIGANVIIFILGMFLEYTRGTNTLYTWGVLDPELVAQGQYWRLFTAMFLHADIMHIFGNMYMLLMLGRALSVHYKGVKLMFVYIVSGLAGCLLSCAFSGYRSLGASGAIMGLGGVLLCNMLIGPNRRFYRHTSLYVHLGIMIVFNLGYGLINTGIDNYGHFGGFVCGFLLELLMLGIGKAASRKKQRDVV